MDACLETGVDYLDTANYEPRDTAKFEYKWQWAYHERFKKAGPHGAARQRLRSGRDQRLLRLSRQAPFRQIEELDIIDCNAGDHGKPFATNFNPEINIREITAARPLLGTASGSRDRAALGQPPLRVPGGHRTQEHLPPVPRGAGVLVKHFPTLKRARFWMTFSENYLTHLRVLGNVGMTRIDPVDVPGPRDRAARVPQGAAARPGEPRAAHQGQDLHRLPGQGRKDGKARSRVLVYNICDHEACYREVGSRRRSPTPPACRR
jgi:saccharopine dehydrogenase (NAD+, L-lysine-forming)